MVYAIVAFSGHSYFLWLTWPSRANKSFPYHVKTNHIGIASNEDDGADYPRHAYEPTPPDATIIIPLSRRTEEFVTGVHGGVNGGVYNPAFVRDVEYLRSTIGPISVPQQCFPSQNLHKRLPSPTNGPPTLTNSKIYGHDVLNDDDDDDDSSGTILDNESGFSKQNSLDTIGRRASSFESGEHRPATSRHSSQDNDSGHLSLEPSASSPNSNENSPPNASSLQATTAEEFAERINSPPPLAPILKDNPFKVNRSQQLSSNKIILDPIKLPSDLALEESSSTPHPNVPRHLFAVKKSGN